MVEMSGYIIPDPKCKCGHFLTAHDLNGCQMPHWETGVGIVYCSCNSPRIEGYIKWLR